MTDGDALRQAVLAQPDDDILRMVYADWLDENGQPDRAAFVRAQVRAAQAEPFSPEARQQAEIATRLLKKYRGEWSKHIISRGVLGWEFARGFIESVQVPADNFPRVAAMFAVEPIRSIGVVQFLSPTAIPEAVTLAPLFEVPELARVTRLDFSYIRLSEGGDFDPLIQCRYLDNLTDLCLRQTPVPPAWLGTMLVGPALPALTGLDLTDVSHLGPRLADALPRCDHRRFARLDISRVRFSSGDIQKVLGSRCLREVEELRIGWMTGTGQPGALTHLDLSWGVIPWNRLRVLDLNGQGIGGDGVAQIAKELARWREPVLLRWLGLAHNDIGADGVRALLHSDPAKLNLYHLDVRGNSLSLSQIAALQTRFPDAVIQTRDPS